MRADDLHVIPLTSFGREKSAWLKRVLPAKSLVQFADERYCDLFGGEDELAGGTLQYLNLDKPIALLPPAADKTAKSDEKPAAEREQREERIAAVRPCGRSAPAKRRMDRRRARAELGICRCG